MRTGCWVGGSPAPGVEYMGKGFGGTTLGACTRDCITGGGGMTATLSSVAESSIMAGCGAGTLCSGTGVGWECTLCFCTEVGWGAGWGRGKAKWNKLAILLYAFYIYEPCTSEGIVFYFFIDRMDIISDDV